jgi:hypothetical protein
MLDTEVFQNWPEVNDADLSCDGKFAFVGVKTNWNSPQSFTLYSLDSAWHLEIGNADHVQFSDDSKCLLFIKQGDSLVLFSLETRNIRVIPEVFSYKVINLSDQNLISYQKKNDIQQTVFLDMHGNSLKMITNLIDYFVCPDHNTIILHKSNSQDVLNHESIFKTTFDVRGERQIWSGFKADNFVLSINSDLAFRSKSDSNQNSQASYWYCPATCDSARKIADSLTSKLATEFLLGDLINFSHDGKRIFFNLKERQGSKPKTNIAKVDVWSFFDSKLQSEQLRDLWPKSYLADLQIDKRNIVRLGQEFDYYELLNSEPGNDSSIYFANRKGSWSEELWNCDAQPTSFLVSTINGQRLSLGYLFGGFQSISSNGHFLVGIDKNKNEFLSYNVLTHVTRTVTETLRTPVL